MPNRCCLDDGQLFCPFSPIVRICFPPSKPFSHRVVFCLKFIDPSSPSTENTVFITKLHDTRFHFGSLWTMVRMISPRSRDSGIQLIRLVVHASMITGLEGRTSIQVQRRTSPFA